MEYGEIMFSKLIDLINRRALSLFIICLLLSCLVTIYSSIEVVKRPPILKNFGDGIQNHLVWSNKGDCFFVKPYNDDVNYLIRVQDCDKK